MKLSKFALLSDAERALVLSIAERIALLPPKERRKLLIWLERTGRLEEFVARWTFWVRPGQRPPDGDWRTWLMLAGRGYGKTRAGAEWVHHLAEEAGLRIAIVGPTEDEARRVMVEGASGLLTCAANDNRPEWEPSRGLLIWPSGSQGFVYSAANPEALRGPEHDFAWCDEIAKWANAEAAWDNLTFGLRRGRWPRALATTTPRPTPLIRRLVAPGGGLARTGGRTADNGMLAESLVDHVTDLYGGTRLGRQELDGELIDDIEGALWTRALIEQGRVNGDSIYFPAEGGGGGEARDGKYILSPFLKRIVVGVDPPASAGGDECGILVCGLGADGIGYVLDDRSVAGLSPEGWARAVARAAEIWGAERVVVETNQGGEMVESVLRTVDSALPVRPVRARYGKGRRPSRSRPCSSAARRSSPAPFRSSRTSSAG